MSDEPFRYRYRSNSSLCLYIDLSTFIFTIYSEISHTWRQQKSIKDIKKLFIKYIINNFKNNVTHDMKKIELYSQIN